MDFQFQSVSIHFEKIPALRNISCEIHSGDIILLTGPTGAGKTSFLRLLYLDILPTAGTLFLNGQDTRTIPKRKYFEIRRKIGIAFQDCKLIENRTVYENVVFPLFAMNFSKREADKRGLEILAEIGISYLRSKFPKQLSGGEKHLAALARSIIHQPNFLIADEPSGNLDSEATRKVADILHKIAATGTSVILATHSQELISLFPDARTFALCEGTLMVNEPTKNEQISEEIREVNSENNQP